MNLILQVPLEKEGLSLRIMRKLKTELSWINCLEKLGLCTLMCICAFQLHDLGQVTSSPYTSVSASIKWGRCQLLLHRVLMRTDEAIRKMHLTHCLEYSKYLINGNNYYN